MIDLNVDLTCLTALSDSQCCNSQQQQAGVNVVCPNNSLVNNNNNGTTNNQANLFIDSQSTTVGGYNNSGSINIIDTLACQQEIESLRDKLWLF